jgi:hypothetical protein
VILFLRVLERIHGHLGWLSVAALLHPAILLRNPKRRARLSVAMATAFVLVSALLGGYIYPEYRARLKQHIFLEVPKLGWMFERKEHLAVGAVTFTLIGCIAHLTAPAFTDERMQLTVARMAHRSFVVAFALAAIVAVIGVAVASYRSF